MRIFVWVLFIVFLFSCGEKVETVKPILQNITESVYGSGVVKSKNQYQVYSAVNGIIQHVHITEGALVHKGDAMITLVNEAQRLNSENARLSADYSSVDANRDKLNELRADIDLARTKLKSDSIFLQRQRNLWEQGIGSRTELDQKELAWKSSVTSYQSALLRYSELKKQVDYAAKQARKNLQISTVVADDYTIKAKQDGKVYSVLKEPGEMVNIQTPVAVIGDAKEFIVELEIDEYDISKIRIGQTVFITMDSYKGQTFEAVICKINPMMDDRSRSLTIEADFTKEPPDLYPNLTVEANILISTKKNVLTIPRDYLVDENHVILKSGEKRKVVVGLKDYQRAEIVSGLTKDVMIKKPIE
ncbi:efflux RND transporter periplasmic adaptor subunit [Chitinophagaceae bacterium LB-8]|uniref:Efflux RND transporter periplasmic adaptor subunit n=1 Tax=Paraflavisolibacter caeni TaxID=2982496 RepID=A0A9X2XZD6_9BACT|nr:efflux RND transporter periplasmic adaptor subunit [Paraflavisolibacter caeni]MCU7552379.1 efflux RND transporter periplasmic adaptor subunit [Paraflavisolibacter caeni]